MDSTNRHMLLAVVEADHDKLSHAAGLTPGSSPHLVSAHTTLAGLVQRTLSQTPNSELARHLADMLQHERLFEVIGKWPPDGSSEGCSGGTTGAAPKTCRHCGALNP